MSSVSDHASCKQCRYPHAYYDLDCDTSEEEVSCGRCGYYAAATRHEESGGVTWTYPEKPGFGVLYYFGGERSFVCQPLRSPEEVEKSEAWLREHLANGDIPADSAYLTRWDPKTRMVEFLIGRPPEKEQPTLNNRVSAVSLPDQASEKATEAANAAEENIND